MEWLSSSPINNTFTVLLRTNTDKSTSQHRPTLGILAFETARTMSRLVALYNSLSDYDIKRLKKDVIKSKGVAYLNSQDEDYLLNLACKEKLEDLSQIGDAVSRLSQRCSDPQLHNFDQLYRDVKLGMFDLGKLEYGTKNIERVIQKMERYIYATSDLYTAVECLAEMEASDRKLKSWMKTLGPGEKSSAEFDIFEDKLEYQRKQVKNYKEISLWNKTFDKCVTLMGQAVFVVHARLEVAFVAKSMESPSRETRRIPRKPPPSPVKDVNRDKDFCLLSDRDKFVRKPPGMKQQLNVQQVYPENNYCLLSERKKILKKSVTKQFSRLQRASPENGKVLKKLGSTRLVFTGDSSPDDLSFHGESKTRKNPEKGIIHLASASTVGGCGLTSRYAKVVILAECYLRSMGSVSDDAREELYEMLPNKVKLKLKSKLKSNWERDERIEQDGQILADGWRDALEDIMGWLGPMAHDTVVWQSERNLEKQMFDAMPGVLLMQTLHFADLDKTEATIVEVLVGLSCIYRFEKRRLAGGKDGGTNRGSGGGGSRGRGRRYRRRPVKSMEISQSSQEIAFHSQKKQKKEIYHG